MIDVIQFDIKHLKEIRLQPAQRKELENMTSAETAYMASSEFAFSAVENGAVLACAGIVQLWPGRGHAWSLLGGDLKKHFVAIHRTVSRALVLSDYRRIEMDVDSASPAAIRWAEMLGFYCETPGGMVNYLGDKLYMKYVRVK